MSETKFTPGPLRASSDPFTHVVLGMDGAEIATVGKLTDAVLFAAAPELSAALEGCLKNAEFRRASGVESGPMIEREIEAARAAIAKAKGV